MSRSSVIFRVILAVSLAAAIAWLAFHRQFVQATVLERDFRRFGQWAPLLFVLLYAAATVLFVPGLILTLGGGALFGPVWGALWNLCGATLGATLAFLAARYIASGWVAAHSGQRLARLIHGVEEEGWRFVAFVRLVPLFPFNVVNYAFGLTRIRLAEYVVASFVCMIPGAFAYTYLGYVGREAAYGQGTIRKGLFALALLASVAFLSRLIRRFKGRQLRDDQAPCES